jgi:hypothetical protein
MLSPIARLASGDAQRLIAFGNRRDDVVGPAELRQRKLDARAGRFLSLDKNELVLVRDDHFRPAVTRRTRVALDREGTLVQRHPGKQGEAAHAAPL